MSTTFHKRSHDARYPAPRRTPRSHERNTNQLAPLEALNLPVSLISPRYTYIWVNSCYAKAHGKHPEDIIGRTVPDLWGEETFNTTIKANLDRCFQGEEVRDEGWVSFPCLGSRYSEVVYSPQGVDGGSAIAAMVITYDVTDRKELEERLIQSEQRFHDLSEASLEAIVFMEQGVIVNANSALSRMFGYEIEEALGKPATNFIAPEYRAFIEEKIGTGSEGVYESVGVRKDGSLFPIEINARELRLRGRRLRVAAVRDLTERKRVEAELKEHRDHLQKLVEERTRELARSEEKFRSIVENATEGIFQVTPGGRFLSANPALARFYGYDTPEDFINATANVEQLHVEPAQRQEFLALLYEEGRVRNFEFNMRRKDNSVAWISVNARLVRDDHGAVLYHEGTVQDITQRKEAEEHILLQLELALKLAATSSLQKALEVCLEVGLKVSQMESGAIYLTNRRTGDLQLACSVGLSKQFQKSVSIVKPDSAGHAVMTTEGPLYLSSNDKVPQPYDNAVREEGLLCRVILPVYYEGEAVARVYLASRTLNTVPFTVRSRLELIAVQLSSILGRIRTGQELREREEHFSLIFDANPGAMLLTSMEGRCVNANRNFLKIVGYTREEVLGKTTAELRLWPSAEKRKKVIRQLLEHGSVYDVTGRVRTKHGELRHIIASFALISQREEQFFLIMFQDVTERKRAEEQLLTQRNLALELAATSSLDEALCLCLDRAMQVSGMDCGSIHLRNAATDDLEMVIHKGISEDFAQRFSQVKAHSKVWSLLTQRRKVAFSPAGDVHETLRPFVVQEGMRSVIMAPVFHKGRVLASMNLGSRQGNSGISARPTLDLIASELGAILVRVRTEQELEEDMKKRKEAEEALAVKSNSLEEANAALKVLLKQRDEDRKGLEERLVANVRQLVLPCVEKLKAGRLDPSLRPAVELVETNLREILSPFLNNVQSFNFTPRQLEIIALIKEGKTTKEIAEFLHVTTQAIDMHRFLLRKKLGLNKEKTNLRSYLLSLA